MTKIRGAFNKIAFGISLAGLLAVGGCDRGVSNPQYTIIERIGPKVATLDIGYKYDFRKGDEKGELLYTIEPSYKGKLKNVLLADNYFLKDKNGNTLYNVDGKIFTISSTHKAYNSKGNLEKEITRKFGSDLFSRLIRLVFNRDGYYVKDNNGKTELDIQETWWSVLSPWLREYKIFEPESKKEIGAIRNKLRGGIFFGAQTYQISLTENSPNHVENIALAIRVIDGTEDWEEAQKAEEKEEESSDDSD